MQETKHKRTAKKREKVFFNEEARQEEIAKAKDCLKFLEDHSNGFVRIKCDSEKELKEVKKIYNEIADFDLLQRIEFIIV